MEKTGKAKDESPFEMIQRLFGNVGLIINYKIFDIKQREVSDNPKEVLNKLLKFYMDAIKGKEAVTEAFRNFYDNYMGCALYLLGMRTVKAIEAFRKVEQDIFTNILKGDRKTPTKMHLYLIYNIIEFEHKFDKGEEKQNWKFFYNYLNGLKEKLTLGDQENMMNEYYNALIQFHLDDASFTKCYKELKDAIEKRISEEEEKEGNEEFKNLLEYIKVTLTLLHLKKLRKEKYDPRKQEDSPKIKERKEAFESAYRELKEKNWIIALKVGLNLADLKMDAGDFQNAIITLEDMATICANQGVEIKAEVESDPKKDNKAKNKIPGKAKAKATEKEDKKDDDTNGFKEFHSFIICKLIKCYKRLHMKLTEKKKFLDLPMKEIKPNDFFNLYTKMFYYFREIKEYSAGTYEKRRIRESAVQKNIKTFLEKADETQKSMMLLTLYFAGFNKGDVKDTFGFTKQQLEEEAKKYDVQPNQVIPEKSFIFLQIQMKKILDLYYTIFIPSQENEEHLLKEGAKDKLPGVLNEMKEYLKRIEMYWAEEVKKKESKERNVIGTALFDDLILTTCRAYCAYFSLLKIMVGDKFPNDEFFKHIDTDTEGIWRYVLEEGLTNKTGNFEYGLLLYWRALGHYVLKDYQQALSIFEDARPNFNIVGTANHSFMVAFSMFCCLKAMKNVGEAVRTKNDIRCMYGADASSVKSQLAKKFLESV
ncbi:MAG: hypothetical protein MJ252_24690 [archaeon]|nr:hypothetical protein [archaeon]